MSEICLGLVVQAYNLSSLRGGGGRVEGSRPACAAEEVQSQPEQLSKHCFKIKTSCRGCACSSEAEGLSGVVQCPRFRPQAWVGRWGEWVKSAELSLE